MKCRAQVANKWWHFRNGIAPAGSGTHPCPNDAKRDGYCYRHHPRNLLPGLESKAARLQKELEKVREQIANLPKLPEEEPVVESTMCEVQSIAPYGTFRECAACGVGSLLSAWAAMPAPGGQMELSAAAQKGIL